MIINYNGYMVGQSGKQVTCPFCLEDMCGCYACLEVKKFLCCKGCTESFREAKVVNRVRTVFASPSCIPNGMGELHGSHRSKMQEVRGDNQDCSWLTRLRLW